MDAARAGSSNELLLELFITNSGLREEVRHNRWRQVSLARTWRRERGHHDFHLCLSFFSDADFGSCNFSVDGLRLFRLRASPRRRPSPPGPGLRVHRLIVAQGCCCCWLFEIAPGIDVVLGTGGAVSGDWPAVVLPSGESETDLTTTVFCIFTEL